MKKTSRHLFTVLVINNQVCKEKYSRLAESNCRLSYRVVPFHQSCKCVNAHYRSNRPIGGPCQWEVPMTSNLPHRGRFWYDKLPHSGELGTFNNFVISSRNFRIISIKMIAHQTLNTRYGLIFSPGDLFCDMSSRGRGNQ